MDADTGDRGGATGVEMALLWVAMLALISAVVQVALLFYAGQLALTAAEDGLRSGRYLERRSAEQARADAQAFLQRAAGRALSAPVVSAELDPEAGVLRVRVAGRALSMLPGVPLPVEKVAVGPVERITP
jgi:Flp pilus assembly protein TadG